MGHTTPNCPKRKNEKTEGSGKKDGPRALSIKVVSSIVEILKESQLHAVKSENKKEEKLRKSITFEKNEEGLSTLPRVYIGTKVRECKNDVT